MTQHHIQIPLGEIDDSALVTDEDFQREAQRVLPDVIKSLGEQTAKVAWEKLQKSLRGPGIKLNSSTSDKRKFIRETAKDFARTMTAAEKRELLDHIVASLREQKDKAE